MRTQDMAQRTSGGAQSSGNSGKRCTASNYLLELVPDQRSYESRRRRTYQHSDSLFQLPPHADERSARQGIHSLSHVSWGGVSREEIAGTSKRRISHTKRRSLSSDQGAAALPDQATSPNDIIQFAESPLHPGVPIVYRPPEERALNPDRLNLDRRHLTSCPLLEGEERLRLLNLQHNSITRLQHLSGLRRLVFLDLYDNFVREMRGLEGLLSLRVLMLGKNRICKISGLKSLVRLDVLDLHGNQVKEIENLSHLTQLRVLNLAGNEVTCVTGLTGLTSLAELNLRRNRITHVYDVDHLPNLQRLFLSHNLIQSFADVSCLARSRSLLELNLDGNPLANLPDHRPSLITHIHCLKSLNQSPIMEDEREEAMAARREEEEKLKEERRRTVVQEYREAAIKAIQRGWDITHTDSLSLHSASTHQLTHSHTSHLRPSNLSSASLPHLLPTFLVDLAPPTLHFYGSGALDDLDTPPRDERPLTSIHFHCIEFEDIVPWLVKVSRAFPDLSCICFECTNLTTLDQLNHLSSLPSPLHTLTISPHGNPLTHHPLFTHYTLYRLHHLQLSVLNDRAVTSDDLAAAQRVFGSLGRLTSTQLQPERLASLVLRHRVKNVRGSKIAPQNMKKRSEEPQDRVALHTFTDTTSDRAHQSKREIASSLISTLHSATLKAHAKLAILQSSWDNITSELVRACLQDYSQLDSKMADLYKQL